MLLTTALTRAHEIVPDRYEITDHGPNWWVLYLLVAAVSVVALMLVMLLGVSRGTSRT